MGKAIQGASVKVGGQAGPLGKGMPVTQAAGPIQGAKSLNDRANASASATGQVAVGAAPGQSPLPKGMGVPDTGGGYAQSKQSWLQQRMQQGKFKNSLWGRMAAKNPAMQKRFQTAFDARQQKQRYGGIGGFFRKAFDQKQANLNTQAPGQPMSGGVTQLEPPTHGGLVSKPVKPTTF